MACPSLSSLHVHVAEDSESLAAKLGYRLEELITQTLKSKQVVTIGLSGGSLIDLLALTLPLSQLPWARLRFFFVDERFVPWTSPDSTYAAYHSKLFRQLPLVEKNVIKIDPTLKSVQECAQDYQKQLKEVLHGEDDSFDIVLLGMGPDGHTASLFPNHPALGVTEGLVTFVTDSPKPPPERVTLTLPTINRAKHKLVVLTGESKAAIVKEVIRDKSSKYPIGQVENLVWYLDKAAASQL